MEQEFHRGRWEGKIDSVIAEHSRRLDEADEDRERLRTAIEKNTASLTTFNLAHKEREAITLALADAVEKETKARHSAKAWMVTLANLCLGIAMLILAIVVAFRI